MKVLIISHNPITTYHSMGKTFLSLFSSFEKKELCQLYIYPTIPDIDKCNSYFRVTDKDVLKSYVKFGYVSTRIIQEKDIDVNQHSLFENESESDFYKKTKKNSFTILCRDVIWKFSNWYNKSLKKWLELEKPTCIFLAPGESKFIYDIALKIAKKICIPLFSYICDDYYFVDNPSGLFDKLQLNMLKHKMKIAMKSSKEIITICNGLSDTYSSEFGRSAHTIFTGSNYPIATKPLNAFNIRSLTYMGNLSCNRYFSIADIGKALDIINKKNGTDYRLFLYTSPLKGEIKTLFSDIHSIQYCGYVTGNDFENILHSQTILIHVEAFDNMSIDRVKHSISTKIADCLGSGNLLFAYGPDNVASIRHLTDNDCAVVVTNHNNLVNTLEELFNNNHYKIIKKEIETAEKCHSSKNNSLLLRNILFAE